MLTSHRVQAQPQAPRGGRQSGPHLPSFPQRRTLWANFKEPPVLHVYLAIQNQLKSLIPSAHKHNAIREDKIVCSTGTTKIIQWHY